MSADIPPTADSRVADPQAQVRRYVYLLVIAAAGAYALARILTATVLYSPAHWPDNRPPHTPMFSANDRSRWCTVWSLVERGTFQIDEISAEPGWDTIDKVRLDGHFYSSKPALLPVVTAGFYWVARHAAGLDLLRQTHETVQVLLLIVNWIPMVASLAVLAAIVERYAQSDWSRYFVVLAAAFGTFLTPFLVTLNNHNVAAASVIFALYPYLRIAVDGRRSWWLFALAGFWGAFAVCNELPACAFGGALFVLSFRAAPGPTLKFFIPAALLPLAAFVATTYASTGEWLPVYSKFGTEAYEYVIDGVPSYWMHPSGIDKSRESPLTYLFHCTLGHHGIFSLTPIFLLTAAGWVFVRRFRGAPLQRICWLSFGLTVWLLGFYLLQTKSYNYGGNTSGLRWAFWLIPLLLTAIVPVLDRWGNRRWVRMTSAMLLLVSTFSATLPHNNPWRPSWLQNLMEAAGWVDYGTPVEPFPRPRQVWFGPLPEPDNSEPQPWIEFTGRSPIGNESRCRIQSMLREPGADGAGGPTRRIEVTFEGMPGESRRESPMAFTVSERAFAAELSPSEVLINPESATGKDAIWFLQGLPKPREFRPGSIRYLKTPLRSDAFRCQIAAAAVFHRPRPDGPLLKYLRVLWLSAEVPFGVVQFEDTVFDAADNAIVFKQRLTASRSSGLLHQSRQDASE